VLIMAANATTKARVIYLVHHVWYYYKFGDYKLY
jgi:hypothetical protein